MNERTHESDSKAPFSLKPGTNKKNLASNQLLQLYDANCNGWTVQEIGWWVGTSQNNKGFRLATSIMIAPWEYS